MRRDTPGWSSASLLTWLRRCGRANESLPTSRRPRAIAATAITPLAASRCVAGPRRYPNAAPALEIARPTMTAPTTLPIAYGMETRHQGYSDWCAAIVNTMFTPHAVDAPAAPAATARKRSVVADNHWSMSAASLANDHIVWRLSRSTSCAIRVQRAFPISAFATDRRLDSPSATAMRVTARRRHRVGRDGRGPS